MAAFSAQELRLLDDAVARAVISTMLDDDEAVHQKYLDLQNRLQEALDELDEQRAAEKRIEDASKLQARPGRWTYDGREYVRGVNGKVREVSS